MSGQGVGGGGGTHQSSSFSSILTKATPLRNSIRSRDGREIGRVLTSVAKERELGRVYTVEERVRAQQAASSLLVTPQTGLGISSWDATSYTNYDAMSGLNINLACRGEFVVKPQVCAFIFICFIFFLLFYLGAFPYIYLLTTFHLLSFDSSKKWYLVWIQY